MVIDTLARKNIKNDELISKCLSKFYNRLNIEEKEMKNKIDNNHNEISNTSPIEQQDNHLLILKLVSNLIDLKSLHPFTFKKITKVQTVINETVGIHRNVTNT